MIWFLLAPLQILSMLICYLTNPIVCLFCDEKGELHGFWNLWQTWDDSCNPRFYVMEKAPKFLQYDYDRHYKEYMTAETYYGRTRWRAELIDPHFTLKERIQRYCCRVLWLARNCGYGFAYYLFGADVAMSACEEKMYKKDDLHYIRFTWDTAKPLWRRPWCIKGNWYYFGSKRWHADIFLGWKFSKENVGRCHAMIANRATPIKS